MKKLSLILVALATMVMVGCKPLTGSTVCTHDWVDTDDEKVASAYYDGKSNLTTKQVSPKYKCSICGEEHEKTIAFFDSPTTIGVATGVSVTIDPITCATFPNLPLNTTWTVEKYNSYYDEAFKNKNKGWTYYHSCSYNCQEYCECDDPDNCVRSYHTKVCFGSCYYIIY